MPEQQHFHPFARLGEALLSCGVNSPHEDLMSVLADVPPDQLARCEMAALWQKAATIEMHLTAINQGIQNLIEAAKTVPAAATPVGSPAAAPGAAAPAAASGGGTPKPLIKPDEISGKAWLILENAGITTIDQCLDDEFISSLKGCGPMMTKMITEWAHRELKVPIDGATEPVPSQTASPSGFAPPPVAPGVGQGI